VLFGVLISVSLSLTEISFDQQGNEGISEVTTEQSLNDGGLEVGQEWDNVFEKFKYPTEPEESGNDVSQLPLDDAIPSDFDILKTDLKLTRSPNSEMEYYVGRAQCGTKGIIQLATHIHLIPRLIL
jgi:hypothetical protein